MVEQLAMTELVIEVDLSQQAYVATQRREWGSALRLYWAWLVRNPNSLGAKIGLVRAQAALQAVQTGALPSTANPENDHAIVEQRNVARQLRTYSYVRAAVERRVGLAMRAFGN